MESDDVFTEPCEIDQVKNPDEFECKDRERRTISIPHEAPASNQRNVVEGTRLIEMVSPESTVQAGLLPDRCCKELGSLGASLPAVLEGNNQYFEHEHLAIKYIKTRSYSVDSSNIYDDFYNKYIEMDVTKPQESYGFVQLDILSVVGNRRDKQWIEVSRWIKYQEDVEAGRWSHPHIASLTFNSITTLKHLIESNGIMLADLKLNTLRDIFTNTAGELLANDFINAKDVPNLIAVLLSKHKHVQVKETGWFILKKVVTAMGANSLQSLLDERLRSKSADPSTTTREKIEMSFSSNRAGSSRGPNFLQSMDSLPLNPKKSSNESLKLPNDMIGDVNVESSKNGRPTSFERKNSLRNLLPPTAEATTVMVGEIDFIRKPAFIFIRLLTGIVLPDVTEVAVPLKCISLVLLPPDIDIDHSEVGRSFGTLMSNTNFSSTAMTAKGMGNLITGINQFLDASITIPPGEWDNYDLLSRHKLQDKNYALRYRRMRSQVPIASAESFIDILTTSQPPPVIIVPKKQSVELESPFTRTGRPFGGLINDFKRRYPKYKSDIIDGINFQCVATVIFMYFASLAQIIPFAVLMGEKTKNMIGISETLLPTAGAGILFALTAGQPLLLLGTTGPLLIFDEILFKVCERFAIEFLPTRVWVSIWLIIITLVAEYFEAIVLIKWCTRFTQDIFTVLTSLLLILECFGSLAKTYKIHPLIPCTETQNASSEVNSPQENAFLDHSTVPIPIPETMDKDLLLQPNTALFCTCLTLGTFCIAFGLRGFKTSVYLSEKVRKNLGHFAVPIAIGLMLAVSSSAGGTYIPKMKVPKGLEPTCPDERGWMIPPTGIRHLFSPWTALAAVIPALLIFVLMFLTTDICELLIDTKERRLSKGNGFHLDILLIAVINFGCGIFGAPWICAPPMRTIAHTDALTMYSKTNLPGEKPSFLGVKEQRLTALAISSLIGCSIFMSPLLQQIPLAVLFGVFLYMGVSALNTTQLYTRINLLFIPAIHHPNLRFVNKVRTKKMHLYTIVQICCLAVLWAVMSAKEAALFFPFILMLLIPIRLQLTRLFTQDELAVLDDEIPMRRP